MKICFILVEPHRSENIGAAARAMNTMGFDCLRLVNPGEAHLADRARWTAHGSTHILDQAGIFPSLAEAVADADFVIGTTAKHRQLKKKYHRGDELAGLLQSRSRDVETAAIVFGRECAGLTNEEFKLCDAVSSLPMANVYPAMNLGQSVMVYAYLLSSLGFILEDEAQNDRDPLPGQYGMLKEKVCILMDQVGIPTTNRTNKKLLGRMAHLGYDDLQLAHYVCDRLWDALMEGREDTKLREVEENPWPGRH